jgi:hypothetical protein
MILLYEEWNYSDCKAGISMLVFHTSTSYFHEKSFHYYKDYNDQTDPRVKVRLKYIVWTVYYLRLITVVTYN